MPCVKLYVFINYINVLIYTQNNWVFGLFSSSRSLGNRGHDVSEDGSVSVFRGERIVIEISSF
jgi:hypothetical protein